MVDNLILTHVFGTKLGLDDQSGLMFGADPAIVSRRTFDVVVSTGEILALNDTSKELAPAPGADKFNILEWALFFLDYAGVAYGGIAAGEDLVISYTDEAGVAAAEIETTGFLDATADAYRLAYPHSAVAGATTALVPVANAALVLGLLTAEIATGTSPLYVKGAYSVVGFTP